jgi:hypothetical protein
MKLAVAFAFNCCIWRFRVYHVWCSTMMYDSLIGGHKELDLYKVPIEVIIF